jgi:hypothetical protein
MHMAQPKRPARTRYDAGSWTVQFLQVDHRGRASRPVLLNARGRRVCPSKNANAVLMAAAPELYEALEALADRADFLLAVLRSDHPLTPGPEELAQARALLARVRRALILV